MNLCDVVRDCRDLKSMGPSDFSVGQGTKADKGGCSWCCGRRVCMCSAPSHLPEIKDSFLAAECMAMMVIKGAMEPNEKVVFGCAGE